MIVESAPIFAPWQANEQEDCILVHASDPDAPPLGNRVCSLPLGEHGMARARLIASAPVLAKALGAAVLALRSYQYGNGSGELAKDIADVSEAMLKAAGCGTAREIAGGPL